jgi:hypothetical protein
MPRATRLYCFYGLIASGKSTLAAAWAQSIDASYHNSDRVRKELAGLVANAPQQASFNAGIYTQEFSRRTYDALLERAAADLGAQRAVVVDGSYQARAERVRLRELAQRQGVEIRFILCRCPEAVMRERMERRAQDPTAVSDGRWEIYLLQKDRFEPPDELPPSESMTMDTDAPVDTLLARLAATLEPIPVAAAPRR